MYYLWINGVLTGGNKEIWITIPLNKPILGAPKVTLIPLEFVVRQNGTYLVNISTRDDFVNSGIEVQTCGFANGTGVTFVFVDSTGFGGDNNDSLAIAIAYDIAFT
jgi:hypothetical protein